jgi:hypothetical protein
LLTILSVADRGPLAIGPNRTPMTHGAPSTGNVVLVQVSRLIRNSSTSPVETRALEIFDGADPAFDTVSTDGGLRVETGWLPKSSFGGLTPIVGTFGGGG